MFRTRAQAAIEFNIKNFICPAHQISVSGSRTPGSSGQPRMGHERLGCYRYTNTDPTAASCKVLHNRRAARASGQLHGPLSARWGVDQDSWAAGYGMQDNANGAVTSFLATESCNRHQAGGLGATASISATRSSKTPTCWKNLRPPGI